MFLKHQYITVPTITKAGAVVIASTQLVMVLQNVIPTNIGELEEE